jgi:hypothetical protein
VARVIAAVINAPALSSKSSSTRMVRRLRDPRRRAGLPLWPGWNGMSGLLCRWVSGPHQTARGRRSDAPPGRRVGREGDLERPSVESTPAGRVSGKIQAICNGKCVPITMQALVMAREKRATQEQWEAMKKQCEEQWKQSDIRARAHVRL